MNLRTLFAIPIAIILIVTLSLAGTVAGKGWSGLIRGRSAIEAVERMRLLLALQTDLRAERVVTNFVLGQPYPLPEPVRRRFDDARHGTDRGMRAIIADAHSEADPAHFPDSAILGLDAVRSMIDRLLARGQHERTFAELSAVMPHMLAVSQLIDGPIDRASVGVTSADESLSGLVTVDHLTESLRDQVGLIAAVVLPRYARSEQPSTTEVEKVRILLARAAYLTGLLIETIEIAGATDRIRMALAELAKVDVPGILHRLDSAADETANGQDNAGVLPPQRLLVPWGERIDRLRGAIVDATVERVTLRQTTRERQFDLALTAFGAVMVAILESIVLLSQRVVGPLAQLGIAITRIAAGDRSTPLTLASGTREMNEMVTAVETLRRAALVADAAALRHRLAVRHRREMLREALGIVRTVQGPAQALERGVASLSEGIDATIAMISAATTEAPRTLGVAATAIRAGLAEMRSSAEEFDATFAAAAQWEDQPVAEFVAHILAVRTQVDRRDVAVRRFVLPSLVALRDAAAAAGEASGPVLRDLVSVQFLRVEETVAVISSMLATVTRASAIVRDLPIEDETPMAA